MLCMSGLCFCAAVTILPSTGIRNPSRTTRSSGSSALVLLHRHLQGMQDKVLRRGAISKAINLLQERILHKCGQLRGYSRRPRKPYSSPLEDTDKQSATLVNQLPLESKADPKTTRKAIGSLL
jgi:hypothetical protein